MFTTNTESNALADLKKSEAAYAKVSRCAPIVRKNTDRQIVYGVVYAPGEVDAHGDIMMPDAIETMAHKFMEVMVDKGMQVIDQQHDNQPVSATPIETWIETEDNRPWPAGSWILGVKIHDAEVWGQIKKGQLNGFSFEAMVSKMPTVVEIETEPDMLSTTAEAEGHTHLYFIEFDVTTGRIVRGVTSMDDGHRHEIKMGTATETAKGSNGRAHAHRLPV